MELTLGLVAGPGTSRANKTGTWRVERPLFLNIKCVACDLCIMLCPEGIIDSNNERYFADLNYCKGCGICAHECPVKDIMMVKEEK